ncbi:endonuclease, partial [candidate division TA06 bacterium]
MDTKERIEKMFERLSEEKIDATSKRFPEIATEQGF